MTRQIYNELELLSEFYKRKPRYFNSWEKDFAHGFVKRFSEYKEKTIVSDRQAGKLSTLVNKLRRKWREDKKK